MKRINAYLASAGLGSRRSVEKLIREGRISVNDQISRELALCINPLKDRVLFDGKSIQSLIFRYVMLNKPGGFSCTRRDPHAKKTVYDLLPFELHHLAYAGRLDVDSEGLVLLSNDGDWLSHISHPRYQIAKIYRVEVTGSPTNENLDKARSGIISRKEILKVDDFQIIQASKKTTTLQVTLREGRNREIRRIFGALHHPVVNLQRVQIGKLKLGLLKERAWRDLTQEEVNLHISSR